MTDRRHFLTAALIAPVVIAAPAIAAPAFVCSPVQDPAWLALLADERRLDAIFEQMVDLRNDAEERYVKAYDSLTEDWQREMDDKGGKPWKFIDARPAHEVGEERTIAGVADFNAFGPRMRDELCRLKEEARQAARLPEAEDRWLEACDAQMAAFNAVIAYPSRDPDIIAHKMRMLLDRFGDDNGDLSRMLASIEEGS